MDYYKLSLKEVFSTLKSHNLGLTADEATQREKKFGKNIITIKHEVSFIELLLYQFKNYLTWLLIFIVAFAFFAGFYLNKHEQIIDGVIISVIIIINVFVGAFQDYKAEKTAKLLRSMLKNEAIVVRDHKKMKINSEELVPGDIILLHEGDKIPADCRIIECKEFHVDESMLTGESEHVLKNIDTIEKTVPLADRKNMVYMNSYVAGGAATCVVTGTGQRTEIGKIAGSLDSKQKSPFTEEVDSASKKITFVAFALIIVVLAIYSMKDQNWVTIFMIGSALVIGSIPEGLPAIVTFTLAIGSLNLARNNVLVKKKTLLETLGGVDVVCTDKTGTLTENKMKVKKLFFDMDVQYSLKKISKESLSQFQNCALLCNEAKETEKGLIGDSEDIALINLFEESGTDVSKLRQHHPAKESEPFSSEKKYASSTNEIDGKRFQYVKGAPEVVLQRCKMILDRGSIRELNEDDKEEILRHLKGFSDDALRNIAFSYLPEGSSDEIFLGFVGIYDSPKKDVKRTIETIYNAGIEIKMITGDNIHTASAIAKECGFRNVKAISWEELKELSKEDLKGVVDKYNIFARMSPEFKLEIVSALQENGRRVAITGDGVNDVPALKKAEVGIAMGNRGTDIAKEAADIILLNDDFSCIEAGIKEGRTIFSNVRKVINYLLTANIAEVFVVFLGSMFNVVPFLAIQLLWVNFVTDIAPAMALGSDPPHKKIMSNNPTGKGEKLINKRIVLLTVFIGLKKVVIMFSLFYLTYIITGNLALAQTISFTWLVMSHFVRIAAIRFDEGVNVFINKYVNWSMIIPVLFQIVIIYSPLSAFFRVVPLNFLEWAIISFAVGLAVLLAKGITYLIDINLPRGDTEY